MEINEISSLFNNEIESNLLFNILFDMFRYYDKEFTLAIQKWQKENNRVLNQNERNQLRKYFYYGSLKYLDALKIEKFDQIKPFEEEKIIIIKEFEHRINTYEKDKIIESINTRYLNLKSEIITDNSERWMKYYKEKQNKYKYAGFIFVINQAFFKSNNYSIQKILDIICKTYDDIENYRHLIINIKGNIFNECNEDITWKLIYKIIIYSENFIQFKDEFFPFKKKDREKELFDFIQEKFHRDYIDKEVEEYYSSISTGYKFEDCLVNDSSDEYLITLKKIKLDRTPIPCPSCMTTIQSGNSFPEVFLRSYECKNPSCPDRSKSGRGKRFDDYGQYRFFNLVKNEPDNLISSELYSKWRRDIFDKNNDILEMITKYYFWSGEKIGVCNLCKEIDKINSRYLITYVDDNKDFISLSFDSLPVIKMFKKIREYIDNETGNEILVNQLNVINGDSTIELKKLKPDQIGAVITSPPYYNAREYSQWQNMILYFIDVLRNTVSIFNTLSKDGYYLYNIGDIVNEDNIYVKSNMSKRRIPLGAYSSFIFELAGFNLVGNIIWDKGQVQSKRNSTINLCSGYVKFINCYEHVLVFKKGKSSTGEVISKISRFNPVIKINSKGENTYGHTAPYPLEMVDLLSSFIKEDKFVLDPYLGSGTTIKWCRNNNYKGIGFELNKEYYNLCLNNIFNK